jgi:DNA-binding MarR family transcriptional regulator
MSDHTELIRRLLEDIASGNALTQRALAVRLGVALGLTNQLLRLLSEQGLVIARPASGRRVIYSLTQAGSDENARLARAHLHRALASYASARDRIRERMAEIAARRPAGPSDLPRVIFYGSGQAAEIGVACAAEMGLRLVGVVDEGWDKEKALFGVPVWPPVELSATSLGGEPFDWILVTELSKTDAIRRQLHALGVAGERVCWL